MPKRYIIPIFVPHAGCPHLCVFCNQKRISGKAKTPTSTEIESTIRLYLSTMKETASGPKEIAFYGGSFTALPIITQRQLLAEAAKAKTEGMIDSIRLSTRPDAISFEILEMLHQMQVDTIELGVQSMDDEVLKLAQRGHTRVHVEEAVKKIKQFDFNLGLQLMPGLPGDTEQTSICSGLSIAKLQPDFVRIYPTLVIINTELCSMYEKHLYVPWSLERAVKVSAQLVLLFEAYNIKVIRVGLQPSEELREEGTVVAGPFHPAFGELVENQICLNQLQSLFNQRKDLINTDIEVYVATKDLSKFIGQKKANYVRVQNLYKLKNLKFIADSSLELGSCYWKFKGNHKIQGQLARAKLRIRMVEEIKGGKRFCSSD